ncbi:MAG: hypothetical protein M1822_007302 [Bathelium mastoideum]|nr:MAG: hypothetical protein M1822_007302 [Bathelium mastoideum]
MEILKVVEKTTLIEDRKRSVDSPSRHIEFAATENEQDGNYVVGFQTLLAIFALALANCNATLSNTTNTIIKFQVMGVGGASMASWIANGNFLMTLACAPILGFLGDRLGKKWFIVGGCALGVAGSFVSSSATNVYTIIGGNILVAQAGVGNAGCIVSIAANQEIIPSGLRPHAFGFAQTINSIAAVLGTFLAATFAQSGRWAWSYRFNGVVYAIAGLSVLMTYRPPPTAIRRSSTLGEIFGGIDYGGILLLTGSLALLVIGLTWGGTTYSWKSKRIVGLLVGGCIGLLLFGLFEWKVKKTSAILDHRLFESYNFPILCFICLIDGMLLLGVNVLYAQEIPDLFNADAIRIAVILSPYLITSTVGCLPAGWLMGTTKSYRPLLIGALLWCSLFTGLMATITSTRLRSANAFSALFGIATAVTTVVPIVALTLSVPSFLLGTAATLSISARALGGIVGVTIFTAIYDSKYATNLPKHVISVLSQAGETGIISDVLSALSSGAPTAVALKNVRDLPPQLIEPILEAVVAASAASWKDVWIAIACIVLAGAIASCFVKSVSAQMTHHIESALEPSTTRDEQMKSKTPMF